MSNCNIIRKTFVNGVASVIEANEIVEECHKYSLSAISQEKTFVIGVASVIKENEILGECHKYRLSAILQETPLKWCCKCYWGKRNIWSYINSV